MIVAFIASERVGLGTAVNLVVMFAAFEQVVAAVALK
jgi:hypothetical protein